MKTERRISMNRTVTVTGTGSIELAPDYTEVTLSVTAKDRVYENAMDMASCQLENIRASLGSAGFAKEDIRSVDFSVNTEYVSRQDSDGNYVQCFDGYRVFHRIRIGFDLDPGLLSDVLRIISGGVAEPELEIRFTVRNRDSASEALLERICADARRKAEILARASGFVLGELVSVSFDSEGLRPYSPTGFSVEDRCMTKMCCSSDCMEIVPDGISMSDSAVFVWEIGGAV